MPAPTIDGQGPRLSEAELADFESSIGERLPDAYRRFLMAHNGGRPTPDTIDIKDLPGGGETDVNTFFGLGREVESSDINWNLKTFSNRIPSDFLPIARDSGGSLFCLAISGPKRGRILYWDAANSFYTAPEDTGRVFDVAPEFDVFLGKIRKLT